MKETLKLRKPLTINGKKVKELTYDFEEIDGNLWDEAVQRSNKSDRNYNIAMYDYIFHKNLFYAAVIAVNPEISWEDLDRITGFDIQSVANTGLFFITNTSEESDLETSERDTESTAKHSTHPSENSDG